MTRLNKIKFMPLDSYSVSSDAEDEICAVDISNVFGNGLFPDWSKKVELSYETTYTVGLGALSSYNAGYIWFGGNWSHSYATINGVSFDVGGWYTQDGHDRKLVFFPASLGDSFSCTNGTSYYFIPVSGEI